MENTLSGERGGVRASARSTAQGFVVAAGLAAALSMDRGTMIGELITPCSGERLRAIAAPGRSPRGAEAGGAPGGRGWHSIVEAPPGGKAVLRGGPALPRAAPAQ